MKDFYSPKMFTAAAALALAPLALSCGDSPEEDLCAQIARHTNWTRATCETESEAFQECADQFKYSLVCLLGDFGWSWSTYPQMVALLREYCPVPYGRLRECTDQNGGIMEIGEYCLTHGEACGYDIPESSSICENNYGEVACASHWTALLSCAMTHSEATCDTTALQAPSHAVREIDRACRKQKLSYFACLDDLSQK